MIDSRHSLVFSGIRTSFLGLCLIALSACSGPTTADLKGKVLSKGKPVVFGTVTVVASDGQIFSSPIQPDGSYAVTGLTPGKVRIGITSPNPRPVLGSPTSNPTEVPAKKGGKLTADPLKADPRDPTRKKATAAHSEVAPPPPVAGPVELPVQSEWRPIPSHYADPVKSGLQSEIQAGSNSLDLKVE